MTISLLHARPVGLRDEHKELTRKRVLEAVIELLAEGSLDELSVPAVADRSGVSLATIYRYFPTKAELLSAAAAEPSRQALARADVRRAGDDDLASFQRAMWTDFAERLPLLRHQVASESGRSMRAARLTTSSERLDPYLRSRGVDPDSPQGRRLTSLIMLLSGSMALLELHDRQGLALGDALDTSRWAVDTLIAATASGSASTTRSRSTSKKGSR
jgi:AcrR family transcriptional regulator